MAEEHPPLDTRITTVERALADIEHRLRAIEHGLPAGAVPAATVSHSRGLTMPGVDVAGTFGLFGRAFVCLAGAYLLRALTESGVFDRSSGAALGFAYAMALTVAAHRVAPRHPAGASFLGGCSVIIIFPLFWEVTIRFTLLTPALSALALTATVTVMLAVAWHRNLQALAWMATAGACGLAGGLLFATRVPVPFAAFLIALGIATLWLGYDREWTGLRWVAALFADMSVLLLIARALAAPPLEPPARVMVILIVLLVGYLGSIAIRTLVRHRDLLLFEAAQTAALLTVGLTGAVLIASKTGTGALMLGPTLLLLAIGAYAVAFAHREWHARAVNYYFYTTLALVFALSGGAFMFERPTAAALSALVALGMSGVARRYGRATFHVHAFVYLLVAAWTTGLAAIVFAALFGPAAAPFGPVVFRQWFVVIAVAACWWMAQSPASPQAMRAPRALLLVSLVAGVAAAGVTAVDALLVPLADAAMRPALVATTRTAAFAAGAVLMAGLGARPAAAESGWLVYPLLAWGLLKLLFEDFRVSPPSLLFVALALYGTALMVAPRLARRTAPLANRPPAQGGGIDRVA